jgi:membrane protease YdiL (CAAX protease family)
MNKATKQSTYENIQVLIVFFLFCSLSWFSQFFYPLFGLVTMLGMALPLVWGQRTGRWTEMGFTRHNLRSALLWGLIGGIFTALIGIAVLPSRSLPAQIGLQLAIGVPIWVFIVSPSQEFFFRGWLQSRLENQLGNLWGLLLANTCFTIWHYFAPFVSQTTVPLMTVMGALSTFGTGLVYAYVFQKTRNIIAPWLAHTLAGVTFILVGAMDFTQPML